MKICTRCLDRKVLAKGMCSRCYYATKHGYICDFERIKQGNFEKNGLCYLGKDFIVDKDDYEKLKNYTWHNNGGNYGKNSKLGYLHRVITPDYKLVDHINRNTFDNRKQNLREGCSINVLNSDKRKKPISIHINKQGKWYGQVQINNKRHYFCATEDRLTIVNQVRKLLAEHSRLEFYDF